MGRQRRTAVVSIEVAELGLGVGWLYRDEPDGPGDSGWRVFSGSEPEDFADEVSNFVEMPLEELLRIDKTLEPVLDAAPGTCWEREEGGAVFRQVRDFDLED